MNNTPITAHVYCLTGQVLQFVNAHTVIKMKSKPEPADMKSSLYNKPLYEWKLKAKVEVKQITYAIHIIPTSHISYKNIFQELGH
jgi:hypothetical protein